MPSGRLGSLRTLFFAAARYPDFTKMGDLIHIFIDRYGASTEPLVSSEFDNMPTRRNKYRRTLEPDDTCNICGTTTEDSFHATVTCTKARSLRLAMRAHWTLPSEECFCNTGLDWFQQLLINCNEQQRSRILMLIWRAWHLRCNATDCNGEETVARSVAFLLNYDKDLQVLRHPEPKDPGKSSLINTASNLSPLHRKLNDQLKSWKPPMEGTLKINVDAGFCKETGEAIVGIIARNHMGTPVIAASSHIGTCWDAEEAEACACVWRMITTWGHVWLNPTAVWLFLK